MISRYEIYPEKRVVLLRLTGRYTLSELTRLVQGICDDPSYRRDYKGLIDITNASADMTMDGFRSLIVFVKNYEKYSTARWAAVASTPFPTAYAMLYRAALEGRQHFEVFSTWEAACSFLDVELAPDMPLRPL